jgi:hypothetical protein
VNKVLSGALGRRGFLGLGGAGLLGLTLPALLRAEHERRQQDRPAAKAKNVIFIWQQGGPPHQDTWDMKPDAPADVRGEFRPIPTSLPGYQVCELLPLLARRLDRLFILRGVHHHIADHNPGCMYLLGSCNPPSPTIFHPSWPAVVKKEFPELPGVPTAVAIPSEPTEGPGPGFLGAAYGSFGTQGDPSAADFQVRSLTLLPGHDPERLRKLRGDTDRSFAELDGRRPDLLDALDRFYRDAHEIILSPATRRAFRIDQEPDRLRDRYGRTKRGQRLLLARRLIEAGVRFVTISEPDGWDTHEKNFERLRGSAGKPGLLPDTDQSLSALLDDLEARGLLGETLVMMFGEFGRTPKINAKAGRDHWSQAMTMVLAGGGVPGGAVYGRTDAHAATVKEHPHSPADFACTVYSLLGIDPHKHYTTPGGQPVSIVAGGEVIRAIVG